MIVNQLSLLEAAPIKDMLKSKERQFGVSYGLTEAGYDIRIAETIRFAPAGARGAVPKFDAHGFVGFDVRTETRDRVYSYLDAGPESKLEEQDGRFILASATEEFQMPDNLVGEVKDKSTWARKGLSVFNTVIEPGWKGFLTLELVYHGSKPLLIPAGAGIAQVLFKRIEQPMSYSGKYQNQQSGAQAAIMEGV